MRNVRAAWIGTIAIAVVCVGFLASSAAAWAQVNCTGGQSITLDSDATAGVYTYFVNSTGPDSQCFLTPGTDISFSGMGGVTNALVNSTLASGVTWDVTHTSSTANFDLTSGMVLLLNANTPDLEIDCSSCVTGTIDWTLGLGDPTVPGPVAATTTVPEPASLALLGTALAGFGLIRRRKRAFQNPTQG